MGAQLLREVAARTSEMAGDGTTTATVLAHAMIQEGLKYLAAGMNPMDLKRGIEQAIEAVVAELKTLAQALRRPRRRSRTWPPSRPTTIARSATWWPARWTRSAARARSRSRTAPGMASELEVVEGLQFDRGYLSPYFINNAERQTAVLEDAAILLYDQKLSSLQELLPLLEEIAKAGRPLLVIAEEVESDALATLVVNTVRGVIKTCAVKAPGFGDRRKAMLQDIAVLTGGQVIADGSRPDAGEEPRIEHLGRARRVEIGQGDTPPSSAAPATPRRSAIAYRCDPKERESRDQRLRPQAARRPHRQAVRRRGADQGRRGHRDRTEGAQAARRRRAARHPRGGRGRHRARRRRGAAACAQGAADAGRCQSRPGPRA